MAVAPVMGAVGAARAEDSQGVASSRMSYSRFLEYLDMGRVKKVHYNETACRVHSISYGKDEYHSLSMSV